MKCPGWMGMPKGFHIFFKILKNGAKNLPTRQHSWISPFRLNWLCYLAGRFYALVTSCHIFGVPHPSPLGWRHLWLVPNVKCSVFRLHERKVYLQRCFSTFCFINEWMIPLSNIGCPNSFFSCIRTTTSAAITGRVFDLAGIFLQPCFLHLLISYFYL